MKSVAVVQCAGVSVVVQGTRQFTGNGAFSHVSGLVGPSWAHPGRYPGDRRDRALTRVQAERLEGEGIRGRLAEERGEAWYERWGAAGVAGEGGETLVRVARCGAIRRSRNHTRWHARLRTYYSSYYSSYYCS